MCGEETSASALSRKMRYSHATEEGEGDGALCFGLRKVLRSLGSAHHDLMLLLSFYPSRRVQKIKLCKNARERTRLTFQRQNFSAKPFT